MMICHFCKDDITEYKTIEIGKDKFVVHPWCEEQAKTLFYNVFVRKFPQELRRFATESPLFYDVNGFCEGVMEVTGTLENCVIEYPPKCYDKMRFIPQTFKKLLSHEPGLLNVKLK